MNFKIITLADYLKGEDRKIIGSKFVSGDKSNLVVDCRYCKKSGLDYDHLSPCPICRGKKSLKVKGPAVTCAFCRGRGFADGRATVCRVCHGKGLVTVERSVEKCPECKGKGKISSTDLMCIRCAGKGIVKMKGENYASGN